MSNEDSSKWRIMDKIEQQRDQVRNAVGLARYFRRMRDERRACNELLKLVQEACESRDDISPEMDRYKHLSESVEYMKTWNESDRRIRKMDWTYITVERTNRLRTLKNSCDAMKKILNM
ncbi:hypothetical protein ACOME3_005996 [Neoechinorhynchus agilis]